MLLSHLSLLNETHSNFSLCVVIMFNLFIFKRLEILIEAKPDLAQPLLNIQYKVSF